jgi:hypothetical protein
MHDEEGQYEGLTERLGMVDYESHYMAPVMGSMYLIMLLISVSSYSYSSLNPSGSVTTDSSSSEKELKKA